ncbi:SH3 domain-containing protein [Pseudoalteromonas distincta]|uniref:SH3 domain-containing protein n=1 Tax=Pseudoalteromonas distincta TaxID=77608 RepID=UPI0039EA2368
MKLNSVLILLFFLLFTLSSEAKNCRKGQPCGNSCISWKKTCRIGNYSYDKKTDFNKRKKINYSDWEINESENASGRFIVTASKLNVRDNPYTIKNIVGVLEKGDEVYVYSIVNGWAMIKFNSAFYYVSSKYITDKTKLILN